MPTDVQEQAWPKIAAGYHVLITAPTGSGKTLATQFEIPDVEAVLSFLEGPVDACLDAYYFR